MVILPLGVAASAEWKEKVLYSFQGLPDGSVPVGAVVFDKTGNLYGATTEGGSSSCISVAQCGTVYQLAPPAKKGDPWTEIVLYVFKGNASKDGASPAGGLLIDSEGNLYGTTAYGGTGDCVLLGTLMGCGTVFEMSPPKQKGGKWTERVLYSFPTAKQGYLPNGDLVFDNAGNLYGATEFGGGFGTTCNGFYQYCGEVFELSPPKTKGGKWTEKVLHGFKGGTDGANPNGGLVLDTHGAVYGTTFYGGYLKGFYCEKNGCGTVFRLNPPEKKSGLWTEDLIHTFKDGSDSQWPYAGVTLDSKGAVYGTTVSTAYRIAPPSKESSHWMLETIYAFPGNGVDPYSPLLFDGKGSVYGTTYTCGGEQCSGSVYELSPPERRGNAWNYRLLYGFQGAPDGAQPEAALIFDRQGNLYSTTTKGGTGSCSFYGCGTVFEVSPP